LADADDGEISTPVPVPSDIFNEAKHEIWRDNRVKPFVAYSRRGVEFEIEDFRWDACKIGAKAKENQVEGIVCDPVAFAGFIGGETVLAVAVFLDCPICKEHSHQKVRAPPTAPMKRIESYKSQNATAGSEGVDARDSQYHEIADERTVILHGNSPGCGNVSVSVIHEVVVFVDERVEMVIG